MLQAVISHAIHNKRPSSQPPTSCPPTSATPAINMSINKTPEPTPDSHTTTPSVSVGNTTTLKTRRGSSREKRTEGKLSRLSTRKRRSSRGSDPRDREISQRRKRGRREGEAERKKRETKGGRESSRRSRYENKENATPYSSVTSDSADTPVYTDTTASVDTPVYPTPPHPDTVITPLYPDILTSTQPSMVTPPHPDPDNSTPASADTQTSDVTTHLSQLVTQSMLATSPGDIPTLLTQSEEEVIEAASELEEVIEAASEPSENGSVETTGGPSEMLLLEPRTKDQSGGTFHPTSFSGDEDDIIDILVDREEGEISEDDREFLAPSTPSRLDIRPPTPSSSPYKTEAPERRRRGERRESELPPRKRRLVASDSVRRREEEERLHRRRSDRGCCRVGVPDSDPRRDRHSRSSGDRCSHGRCRGKSSRSPPHPPREKRLHPPSLPHHPHHHHRLSHSRRH